MSIIELSNLYKTYGKGDAAVNALNDFSLNIDKGDFLAIIGPSGSGKSTLLNILGCLDCPTSGTYIFNDVKVNELNNRNLAALRNEKFGFVVQDFALIENYSVKDNVELPLIYSKKYQKKDRRELIQSSLSKMGILNKMSAPVRKLSGGQRQRVAIARALINDPDVILADEPTGALDKKTGDEVMTEFEKLHAEGKTIIVITHDLDIASRCSKVVNIVDGALA